MDTSKIISQAIAQDDAVAFLDGTPISDLKPAAAPHTNYLPPEQLLNDAYKAANNQRAFGHEPAHPETVVALIQALFAAFPDHWIELSRNGMIELMSLDPSKSVMIQLIPYNVAGLSVLPLTPQPRPAIPGLRNRVDPAPVAAEKA